MRRAESKARSRGFTLAELLLAMAILAIGAVAVAALFPAGIVQQRRSADDVMGPIVASNALSVLRSKLSAADFGTYEEFDPGYAGPTVHGDWSWKRPGFIFANGTYPFGGIDVFSATGLATADEGAAGGSPVAFLSIPHNRSVYGDTPPPVVFTQLERYYPMAPEGGATGRPARPQYVWDCMFRRHQGRVQAAIFVYRVTLSGSGGTTYSVPPNPSDDVVPPLPIHLSLAEPWDADGDPATPAIELATVIPGTEPGTPFDPSRHDQAWQAPGQWLLDQSGTVHRVLAGRRNAAQGPVELMRPIAALPDLPVHLIDRSGVARTGVDDVVSDLWYIPGAVEIDSDGDGAGDLPVRLAPVYVTVREL